MLDQVHNAFEKMASAFKEAEDKAHKAVLVASSLVPTATAINSDVEEIAGHLMFLDEHRLDKIVSKVKANGRLSPIAPAAMNEMANNVRKIVWKDEDTTKNQGGADGNAKNPA